MQENATINKVQIIQDGIYTIETGINSNKAIDVIDAATYSGGNVQIFNKNNARCQTVIIKYVGEGYYTIQFYHSKLYLDVANGQSDDNTNVWQYTYNGSNAQLWKIIKNSDNTYTFISKLGNFALDLKGAKTVNGTNIQIYSSNNSNAQKFGFKKI